MLAAFDRTAAGPEFTAEDQRLVQAFAASAATAVMTAQNVAAHGLQRSVEASERERMRWARELHDETLQELAALRINPPERAIARSMPTRARGCAWSGTGWARSRRRPKPRQAPPARTVVVRMQLREVPDARAAPRWHPRPVDGTTYPVALAIDGLALVKWLLAIPHYVVLAFLWIVAVVVAWFAILFTGRCPRGLFDFVVGVGRWHLRVLAFAFALVTGAYPPFRLTP